jgi:hypothetical protein
MAQKKDRDKSIIEKFTDTVRDLADTASQALKSDEPKRVDETTAVYLPFAAEGMVSDPLIVAPIAVEPARKRRTARKPARRAASKRAGRAAAKKSARKPVGKTARTTAKKSRPARAKTAAARTVKKASRTTAKRGRAGKARRSPR